MIRYHVRPYAWADQLAAIIPKLEKGDEIIVPTIAIVAAMYDIVPAVGNGDVSVYTNGPGKRTCKICGTRLVNSYCHSCETGERHSQDCPGIWSHLDADKATKEYVLRREGISLDATCNCGGDELSLSLEGVDDTVVFA